MDKKAAMKRIIELTHSENWQEDKEIVKKQQEKIERQSKAVEILLAGYPKEAYKSLMGCDLGTFEY